MGDLKKWVDQKWVDIGSKRKDGSFAKCGRSKQKKDAKRKYPKCVPLAKATRMSDSQRASAVRRKRAAGNTGPKPTNVKTFNSNLLWEPWEILKDDGTPYKVFSPFYKRGCLNAAMPRRPIPKPHLRTCFLKKNFTELNSLNLLPSKHWYKKFNRISDINFDSLESNVNNFFSIGIKNYKRKLII